MKYFFCYSDAGQDTVFFNDELRFSHGIVWNAAKRCVVAVSYVFRKRKVDEEVVELVGQAHAKATQILRENILKLHELAAYLLKKETITGDEFMAILNDAPQQA